MPTILAATDFSDPSHHAAARAAALARATAARLELLHVIEGDMVDQLRRLMGLDAEPVMARLLDEARADMAQLAGMIDREHKLAPHGEIGQGYPYLVIAERAERIDAGLVVLGARGAGFLRRALLGATSERLLRKSTRAMLVVRREVAGPYRRVLLPVDLSPLSAQAVAAARTYAPEAETILFHAYEVPFEGKLRYAGVDEATVEHYRQAARATALAELGAFAQATGLTENGHRLLVGQGAPDSLVLEQEELQAPLSIGR
ncbi:MAG: universal stress protein [Thiobacillus sp.]|nr:universal stress protein [Thiobacillus sp.]